MSRISWDQTGERLYKTGIDHVVLYPQSDSGTYPLGIAWNGISNVSESPSGGEENPIYADNIKYLSLMSNEEFGASVEAYDYPVEFNKCNGIAEVTPGAYVALQNRQGFGLSYRNLVGNDIVGTDYGYELHLVWNAKCQPSEESHDTVNDSPEATAMSWEVKTTAVVLSSIDSNTGKPFKPTSHIKVDSTILDWVHLKAIEDALYGTDSADPYLPSPDAVIAMMRAPITYTAVATTTGKNPALEKWYERSGTEGSYTYTLTTDTTPGAKTYYAASLDLT